MHSRMVRPLPQVVGAPEVGDLRLLEHCSDCFAALNANVIEANATRAGEVHAVGECRKTLCYWALTRVADQRASAWAVGERT